MNEAPDPACRRPYIALLEIPLNHLKNKGPAINEVAQEKATWDMLWQVESYQEFTLTATLKVVNLLVS